MIGFQCACRGEYALRIVLEHIVSQQHQGRPDSLTTKRQHILDRLIQAFRFTIIADMVQIIVDQFEDFIGVHHIYSHLVITI